MQHDLFKSIRDLDLGRPEVKIQFFRIAVFGVKSALVDPPCREKHDSGKIIALSQIAWKLLKKNYVPGKGNGTFFLC